jgi:hypothetical protein
LIFIRASQLHRHKSGFSLPILNAVRRDGFFPKVNLSKLHNTKSYIWIQPDGSSMHAVYFCPLEESLREELILQHYLSHAVRTLGDGPLGVNVLSRDQPWDFELELSNGTNITIEICSITDRDGFFTKLSAEELLERHSHYPEIRLGILKKIEGFFPSEEGTAFLDEKSKQGFRNSDDVENPYFPPSRRIYTSLSDLPPLDPLDEIRIAIRKKQTKKHSGKNETVLLVDNRTSTASLTDFEILYPKLIPLLENVEFPEIWLYTGYGGGHKKSCSDFLLLPLKLPFEYQAEYLRNV